MKPHASLLVAFISLITFNGPASAADDLKGISGYGCFPQSGRFMSDFYWAGGAIVNRSTTNRRDVVCTIFRDYYAADTGFEVDAVAVYFERGASPISLACQVLVRDLTTGAIVDSDTKSSSIVGRGRLLHTNLSYASDNEVIYLFCQVPPNSRIFGLRWEEDVLNSSNGTDLGEGEGLN
jgi:hypothetical protein